MESLTYTISLPARVVRFSLVRERIVFPIKGDCQSSSNNLSISLVALTPLTSANFYIFFYAVGSFSANGLYNSISQWIPYPLQSTVITHQPA